MQFDLKASVEMIAHHECLFIFKRLTTNFALDTAVYANVIIFKSVEGGVVVNVVHNLKYPSSWRAFSLCDRR